MNALRHYLLALQFFTRVPVTGRVAQWVGYGPDLVRASTAHFPGVGLLVGLLAAGVAATLLLVLPPSNFTPLVAAVLSTIATVLFTGALHEDGLADVADGLGGSPDRERALAIMKDSRVGAFGVLALVLAVAAKMALLALLGAVDIGLLCAALLLAHVLSRAWPLLLIRWLPYVGDPATTRAKPLAGAIGTAGIATGFAWAAVVLAILGWAWGPALVLAAIVFSAAACAWMALLFRRRLQGFTGDCLGATQQVCEIACYFGMALAA